eukprot:CAMPEP_0173217812 /NCGR_PEP_ID=MMETSP1142-20121109/708_1 /TAXON_ID=483371 /ORGANISM="non described non described, Strain CCMP2298" /LENGTH=182 /DNA_ID=CAMNT_0014145443 /DNA_START=135 /DNA_END=680 /DNA_ORIENTATION=+
MPPVTLDEHTAAVTRLRAPLRTNLLLSSSLDGTVRIWGPDGSTAGSRAVLTLQPSDQTQVQAQAQVGRLGLVGGYERVVAPSDEPHEAGFLGPSKAASDGAGVGARIAGRDDARVPHSTTAKTAKEAHSKRSYEHALHRCLSRPGGNAGADADLLGEDVWSLRALRECVERAVGLLRLPLAP